MSGPATGATPSRTWRRRPGGPWAAVRIGAVITAVVATVGACGGHRRAEAPVDPTTTSAPTVAPSLTVRIGFLGTSVGPGSALSRTVENAERLAVSQFTSDHPGIDVVVDVRTTGGTSAGAAAAARRLVADGVVAVIGPQTPLEVRGAVPILSAAAIPALTATATETDLSESGWTAFFRVAANDQQQGVDEAQELVTSLRLSSLVVLAGAAAPDRLRATWVSSQASVLGATIVRASGASSSGASSSGGSASGVSPSRVTTVVAAAAAARRVVEAGVGGVYFSGRASVARALVTSLTTDGYQGVILIAADAASVLRPLGSGADGVYTASPADNPAVAAAAGGDALVFDDAYHAAFGAEPPTWGAEAYDATNIVLMALAAGATTGPTVGDYLFNHTSVGVSALVSFDSSGDLADAPVFISQIRGGVSVQMATVTPASS